MRRRYNLGRLILASAVVLGLTLMMVAIDAQARIAFESDRGWHWEIYVMDNDGGNQRNLSNNPAEDMDPSWSPDGKWIAFASDREAEWPNYDIYVMGANGGNQRRLTNDRHNDRSPSWSPDGKRIAFVSTRDGNAGIYVMDADGGNQRRLTKNRRGDISPAWYNPAFAVAPAGKILTIWGWLKQVDR